MGRHTPAWDRASRPRRRRGHPAAALLLTGVFLVLLAVWWRGGALPTWDVEGGWNWGSWGGSEEVLLSEQTAQELDSLPVREKTGQSEYRRDAFGRSWADEDRNGCDTRNDILARDLVELRLQPGQFCKVTQGVLMDPYSGQRIEFTAGPETSKQVQIDHVVALSDAWASGARDWEPARRQAMANDPLNLLAVEGELNQEKGNADAAGWLPPDRAYRCEYVARQIRVKATYQLSVTAQERAAMLEVLADCPAYELPA